MPNANHRFGAAPSREEIEVLAAQAFETIPAVLREKTVGILFRVEEFPDEDVCRDLKLESPFELMGLCQGVDLTQKSVLDPAPDPDLVFLYRRPILDFWCETGEDLDHLVRHVLIHEIGHHFGFSDEDMEALEASVPEL